MATVEGDDDRADDEDEPEDEDEDDGDEVLSGKANAGPRKANEDQRGPTAASRDGSKRCNTLFGFRYVSFFFLYSLTIGI